MFQRVTASVAGTRSHARCSLKSGNWGLSGGPWISLGCTPSAALSGRSTSSLALFSLVALLSLDMIVTEGCKSQGTLAYSVWCLQVTSHTPPHSKTSIFGRASSPRHDSAHRINLRRQCTPHLPVYMLPAVCCHKYRHVTRVTVVSCLLVLRPTDLPHFRLYQRCPLTWTSQRR